MARIKDWILSWLQRDCKHPGDMVAADVLKGEAKGIAVKWCRRCGAVKTDWDPFDEARSFITIEHWWRMPDPNLWRG